MARCEIHPEDGTPELEPVVTLVVQRRRALVLFGRPFRIRGWATVAITCCQPCATELKFAMAVGTKKFLRLPWRD